MTIKTERFKYKYIYLYSHMTREINDDILMYITNKPISADKLAKLLDADLSTIKRKCLELAIKKKIKYANMKSIYNKSKVGYVKYDD